MGKEEKESESTGVKRRGKREGKKHPKNKEGRGAGRDGLRGCRDPGSPIPTHV